MDTPEVDIQWVISIDQIFRREETRQQAAHEAPQAPRQPLIG